VLAVFIWSGLSCEADQFKPLRETQLKEFFKTLKIDNAGLHYEQKAKREFSVKDDGKLMRRGTVYTLPFGGSLEMTWEHGTLQLTPREDVTGSYFQAMTSTGGVYFLRLVTSGDGPRLEIEEE
jgi:hypothetical protein